MEEISLREIIEVLLKRKWLIICITLAALLLSGVVSFFYPLPCLRGHGGNQYPRGRESRHPRDARSRF